MKRHLLPPFAILAGLTATSYSQIEYEGADDGVWTTGANWIGGTAPTSSDVAVFDDTILATSSVSVPAGSVAGGISASAIAASSVTLTDPGSGTLEIPASAGTEVSAGSIAAYGLTIEPELIFSGTGNVNFELNGLFFNTLTINDVTNSGLGSIVFSENAAAFSNINIDGEIDNGSSNIRIENGNVNVRSTGGLTGDALWINTSGILDLDASSSLAVSSVEGDGTIDGDLDISGDSIRPRADTGADGTAGSALSVTGNLTSDSGSSWLLDVSSSTAVADMVNIDGSASLAGSLTITDPSPASIGTPITLVTFASRGGTEFDSVSLPSGFSVRYTDTAVLLVPEVSTTLPLLAILTPFFFGRRRRKT